ncbi:MAG: acetolactate synthase small subunit [Candidatus Methanofastidiosia archaeon]
MKHTIALLVKDNPGVLAKIAGLFSRRGFNIESLAVGHTEERGISRMTIVAEGDDRTLEQIKKQLNKLIDTIKVTDLDPDKSVGRELAFIKVNVESTQKRSEIMQIADIFRAKIVDIGNQTITIEVTGVQDKVDALIDLLRSFGIRETVRTGKIALARGIKIVHVPKYKK